VLSMLKRRPCSLNDICAALGISAVEVSKYLADFSKRGIVDSTRKDGTIFFIAH
jgi:DNA-binding IclR family transcriptional regulator